MNTKSPQRIGALSEVRAVEPVVRYYDCYLLSKHALYVYLIHRANTWRLNTHLGYTFPEKCADRKRRVPLICIPSTELPVVVATTDIEHAIGTDQHGVIAACGHTANVFPLGTSDYIGPENPLRDVAKPQLSIVVPAKPKDVISSREDDGVVVPATQVLHLSSIQCSFHRHEVLLRLCRFQPELAVVILSA